eukprot:3686372-Pleurochrysis_carterae.AAC.2
MSWTAVSASIATVRSTSTSTAPAMSLDSTSSPASSISACNRRQSAVRWKPRRRCSGDSWMKSAELGAVRRARSAIFALLGGAHFSSTPKQKPRCPSSSCEPSTPCSSSRISQ